MIATIIFLIICTLVLLVFICFKEGETNKLVEEIQSRINLNNNFEIVKTSFTQGRYVIICDNGLERLIVYCNGSIPLQGEFCKIKVIGDNSVRGYHYSFREKS